MPVLVLQGTFSHDRPGSLDVLRTLRGKFPVFVADKIQQVALVNGEWEASAVPRFENFMTSGLSDIPQLIVSCLPSIHKGTVKAMAGDDATAASLVEQVCAGWAEVNLAARAVGIPTVLTTHGTVNGAITESHYAMVSPDHEFSPGILFSAQASAVMVGHIHAHNAWEHEGRRIAYPGSITRLVFGHNEPTYWLDWEVGPAASDFLPRETPSRRLVEISFAGRPDMAELAKVAAGCGGAYVRVRYTVDEEHRHTVDAAAIRELLAAASDVRIEGSINPIQRTRSEGLARTESLDEKLNIWGRVTETKTDDLHGRLADLQIHDADTLVAIYGTAEGEKDHATA